MFNRSLHSFLWIVNSKAEIKTQATEVEGQKGEQNDAEATCFKIGGRMYKYEARRR